MDVIVVTYKDARVDASETTHGQNMRARYSLQLRLLARASYRVIIPDYHRVFVIGLGKPTRIVRYKSVNSLMCGGYLELVVVSKAPQCLHFIGPLESFVDQLRKIKK